MKNRYGSCISALLTFRFLKIYFLLIQIMFFFRTKLFLLRMWTQIFWCRYVASGLKQILHAINITIKPWKAICATQVEIYWSYPFFKIPVSWHYDSRFLNPISMCATQLLYRYLVSAKKDSFLKLTAINTHQGIVQISNAFLPTGNIFRVTHRIFFQNSFPL